MPSHGRKFTRRSFLRGAMQGAGLGLGLPLLDMFLNDHGTALASGAPLPVRYGTWFWGLGHTPGRGMISGEGSDYEFLSVRRRRCKHGTLLTTKTKYVSPAAEDLGLSQVTPAKMPLTEDLGQQKRTLTFHWTPPQRQGVAPTCV